MAINLITQPGATVPYSGSDYIQQNLLINAALAQGDEVLTDWAESTAAPAIKQGVYFYHSGNSYQVQDSDSSISGTPVSGANYIGLAESGGVLTASYVTDISGYTWNPAYNGLYDGTTLIIRAVTYLIGSAYHRGLGADKSQSGIFILSDGSLVTALATITSLSATTGGFSGAITAATGTFSNSVTVTNSISCKDGLFTGASLGEFDSGLFSGADLYSFFSSYLSVGESCLVSGAGGAITSNAAYLFTKATLNATTTTLYYTYLIFSSGITTAQVRSANFSNTSTAIDIAISICIGNKLS